MIKFAKYLSWNMMTFGGFVLSTLLNLGMMAKVYTVFFIAECILTVIATFIINSNREDAKSALIKHADNFTWYNALFEVLFVTIAFFVGNMYVAVCMFITLSANIYIFTISKQFQKE